MPTAFSLHTHEKTASGDSGTPARVMAQAAAERGLDLVGFVGHDDRPSVPDDLPVETMTGVEHEIRTKPTRLHIVSFPDQGLDILAHPSLTWPQDTVRKANEEIESRNLDAVEMFSRGKTELPEWGEMDAPVVANDDAHNTGQVGVSYMVTNTRPSPRAVAQAVKSGRVRLVNRGYSDTPGASYRKGRLHQGINLLGSRFRL